MLYPNQISSRFGLELFRFDSLYAAVGLGGGMTNYQVIFPDGRLRWQGGNSMGQMNLQGAVADADFIYPMYYQGWHFFASKRDLDTNEYWSPNPWIHGLLDHWDLLPDGVGGLYVAYSWYRDFRTDWVGVQRIYPDGHFGGDTTVAVYDELPILPGDSFQLTNCPNPFNSSTTISYSLSEEAFVRLEIYNSLGQHVKTLVSESQSAGPHTVAWNADSSPEQALGSGPYFYRLKTDNASVTRKMLILK
jgi:hypothetical protein